VTEFKLGKVAGLELSATSLAAIGTISLWTVLAGVGLLLGLSLGQAIVAGLIATILHWVSELVHHLGHAWAARRTGYPMSGVRFGAFLVLGTSLYPEDEGDLPAAIHMRRALGGPVASILFALLAGLVALLLRSSEGLAWWIALFVFVENLLLLGLGAFLPLGFTDGSTLLYWRGKR
jgi:hypothetical protein